MVAWFSALLEGGKLTLYPKCCLWASDFWHFGTYLASTGQSSSVSLCLCVEAPISKQLSSKNEDISAKADTSGTFLFHIRIQRDKVCNEGD